MNSNTERNSRRSRLQNTLMVSLLFVTIAILTVGQPADAATSFTLPWRAGDEWRTSTGNNQAHHTGSANRHAFDFVPYGGARDEVVTATDGTVCYVQKNVPNSARFYSAHAGNIVILAHGGSNCAERRSGTYTSYAHLMHDTILVRVNQTVTRGTVLGRMGDTGYAAGRHLHFTVYSQYWTYSDGGYRTASGISKSVSFVDPDVAVHAGVPQTGWRYRSDNAISLQAKHSGKCADIAGPSRSNGAILHQWGCYGGDNQAWQLRPVGNHVALVSIYSDKCLDVAGWSRGNGGKVHLWDCHYGGNQLWRMARNGDGSYRVINKHSGKCLDVSGVSHANGARIHQWSCYNNANQRWRVTYP